MAISSIITGNLYATNQNSAIKQCVEKIESEKQANIDKYESSSETEKFSDIVSQYDVTSMNHKQMCQMSKELYDNDLISLKEHMFFTFDREKLAQTIQEQTGNSNISISGWKVPSNDEKIDYIDMFKTMADFKEQHGLSSENENKILELFDKIAYFQQ
ncbi:MAG: hypothetical protein PHV68_01860 [Candidatus Gastranaerophilales bacterium]|nr:hypothetical protein [Candidatus Gastranaerophilales bacterium]